LTTNPSTCVMNVAASTAPRPSQPLLEIMTPS
jgi:hypothetical protein